MRPSPTRRRPVALAAALCCSAMVFSACGATGSTAPTTTAPKPASSAPAEQERVSVPNVAKLAYPEARKRLEDEGFKVVVPVDISGNVKIGGTSPSAGAFIPKGSAVELRVDTTSNAPAPTTAKSKQGAKSAKR